MEAKNIEGDSEATEIPNGEEGDRKSKAEQEAIDLKSGSKKTENLAGKIDTDDKSSTFSEKEDKSMISNEKSVDLKTDKGEGSGTLVEDSQKPTGNKSAAKLSTSSFNEMLYNGMNIGDMESKSGSLELLKNSMKCEKKLASHKPSFSNGCNVGSVSAKNMYFRADTVDLLNWDVQLDKRLSRVFSRDRDTRTKKEEWEIDLAKLDLKNVIAHGTYGTVYKATYDGKDVAVKVLDWGEDGMATVAETASLRASFRKEVAVWHKLDHPNVTKFIGASMGTSNLKIPTSSSSGDREGHPTRACCVVVEYLAGGTLKNYLIRNRRRKLAIKVVIQLALDLARGLSYLHAKKIVHRDVKTENMLLDTSRNLKIADFGVARVEAQNPKDMTGETGTLGYMAPEVIDGKPYNRKCDVYSFGICLWEIYCCDMPYPDLSFADVSYKVVRQDLRPDMPRCCPASLVSIMRKCWDANPDKRPEMDHVVSLLEAVDTSKGGGMIPDDQVVQSCFCFGPNRGP